MEIHGSYLLLYGVGIILMIVNMIQSICRPKGKFFNPPQMEEKRDDKTVFRMRMLYAVSQLCGGYYWLNSRKYIANCFGNAV